jgi:hypothetical protein
MNFRANTMFFKLTMFISSSREELVEPHIMLEVAHEVVITSVKSSQPLTHTRSCTPSQSNISCTNECASQASHSLIKQNLI